MKLTDTQILNLLTTDSANITSFCHDPRQRPPNYSDNPRDQIDRYAKFKLKAKRAVRRKK